MTDSAPDPMFVPPANRETRILAAIESLRCAEKPIEVKAVAELSGIGRATLYREKALRDLIADASGVAYTPQENGEIGRLKAACERLRERNEQLLKRRDAAQARLEELEYKIKRETIISARILTEAQRQSQRLKTQRVRITKLKEQLQEAEERVWAAEQSAERAQKHADEQERLREEAEDRDLHHSDGGSAKIEEARQAGYKSGYDAGARVAMRAARRGTGSALNEAAGTLSPKALAAARRRLARVLHPDLFADDPETNLLATEILKQINALAAKGDGI